MKLFFNFVQNKLFYEIIFVQNHIFTPKCKLIIIMCSDNIFSIIFWGFITLDTKIKKLQLFPSTYPNKKWAKFQILWHLKSVFSYPLSTQTLDCSNKKSKIMHDL